MKSRVPAVNRGAPRKPRPLPKERPQGHPASSNMDYTEDQTEFLMAVDAFKTRTGKQFPTNCEILTIVQSLGYKK